jgi:hypothetical protein
MDGFGTIAAKQLGTLSGVEREEFDRFVVDRFSGERTIDGSVSGLGECDR